MFISVSLCSLFPHLAFSHFLLIITWYSLISLIPSTFILFQPLFLCCLRSRSTSFFFLSVLSVIQQFSSPITPIFSLSLFFDLCSIRVPYWTTSFAAPYFTITCLLFSHLYFWICHFYFLSTEFSLCYKHFFIPLAISPCFLPICVHGIQLSLSLRTYLTSRTHLISCTLVSCCLTCRFPFFPLYSPVHWN